MSHASSIRRAAGHPGRVTVAFGRSSCWSRLTARQPAAQHDNRIRMNDGTTLAKCLNHIDDARHHSTYRSARTSTSQAEASGNSESCPQSFVALSQVVPYDAYHIQPNTVPLARNPSLLIFNIQQCLTRIDRVPLLDRKRENLFPDGIVPRRDPDRRLHRFQLDDTLIVVLDNVSGLGVEFPHVGREGRDDGSAYTCRCLSCISACGGMRWDGWFGHTLRHFIGECFFLGCLFGEVLLEQLFLPACQLNNTAQERYALDSDLGTDPRLLLFKRLGLVLDALFKLDVLGDVELDLSLLRKPHASLVLPIDLSVSPATTRISYLLKLVLGHFVKLDLVKVADQTVFLVPRSPGAKRTSEQLIPSRRLDGVDSTSARPFIHSRSDDTSQSDSAFARLCARRIVLLRQDTFTRVGRLISYDRHALTISRGSMTKNPIATTVHGVPSKTSRICSSSSPLFFATYLKLLGR